MRRYFWGLVIILVVMALAMSGVWSVRMEHSAPAMIATESGGVWDPVEPIAVQRTVPPTAPAKVDAPPRRPRNWLKPERPAETISGPPWQGIIERSCVKTLADSRNEIVEVIRDGLGRELGLHRPPPTNFVLSPAFVRFAEISREPLKKKDETIGDVVHIRYQVELLPDGWQELGRLERAERGEARMELAARGLGLFTVLLGAIAAYIRLDEMTKGYYSGRLFLVAAGIVAGLGVLIVRPM